MAAILVNPGPRVQLLDSGPDGAPGSGVTVTHLGLDGDTVVARATSGDLVRIDLATGTALTMLGSAPQVTAFGRAADGALLLAGADRLSTPAARAAELPEGSWEIVIREPAGARTVRRMISADRVDALAVGVGEAEATVVVIAHLGRLAVWDVRTGDRRHEWEAHTGTISPATPFGYETTPRVNALALALARVGDEPVLVSAGDEAVRSWGPQGGALHALELPEPCVGVALQPSVDGELLVAAGLRNGTVRLWEAVSGQDRGTIAAPDERLLSVALGRDDEGSLLVTAGMSGTCLWDLEHRDRPVADIPFSAPPWTVALATDRGGAVLLAGGAGGVTAVRGRTRGRLWQASWHVPAASSAAVVPAPTSRADGPDGVPGADGDGDLLVVGTDAGALTVLDCASGGLVRRVRTGLGTAWSMTIARDGDGQSVAVVGGEGMLEVREARTGVLRRTIAHAHGLPAPREAFRQVRQLTVTGSSGRRLVSLGADERVRLIDLASGEVLRTLEVRGRVEAMAAGPDAQGRDVVVLAVRGGADLLVHDLASGELLSRLGLRRPVGSGLSGRPAAVVVGPDGAGGTVVAAVTDDGELRAWDLSGGDLRGSWLVDHGPGAPDLVLIGDRGTGEAAGAGPLLLAAAGERLVQLVDLRTGEALEPLPHTVGSPTHVTAGPLRAGRATLALYGGQAAVQLYHLTT
ncbi:MAG: PQQ-binding-like beta-propeller repeat protein [Kineosporiaceae bacterium]|nr:PQQ-binding-like beta-propeller repeat protein [Kineosporiaceae bacterium]